jgi:hypothetical protein
MFGLDFDMLLPIAKKKLKEENCKSFIFSLTEKNKDGYVFEKKNYDVSEFLSICETMVKENETAKKIFLETLNAVKNGK